MDALFLKLVNMSISASWLVLAVMLARVVLKKAPRGLLCALWALVAIRLVCPFTVESVLSLIPSAQTLPSEILLDPTPAIHSGVTFIDSAVNPVLSESLAPVTGASVNPMQIWTLLASLVWALGMGVMVIYALFSYFSIRIKVSASVERDGVWICDYIASPFILGVFRPRIYLPSALDGDSAAHVIAHERAHLKRHDHWWKPLGFALLTVYWFNPLMWAAYVLLCRDIELACDERVVKDMGAEEKKAYSEALLECSVPRRMIAACPLAFGEVGVKARVKSVLNYKKPAFWVILVALIACVAVAVCFMTDPVEDTTEEDPFAAADSPYRWTSLVGSEDVNFCQATIWDEEQRHITIEGANLDNLIAHLNDVKESEVRLGERVDHSVSVMVNCGGGEYLLQYADGLTQFVFDTGTAEKYPDGVWVIENTALSGWMEELLIPAELEENSQEVSISRGYANMALTIPEGWAYEVNEYSADQQYFGISFRPEGELGWTRLQFWPDQFGVCGTGLEEKQITLRSGLRATQGYYDGSESWSFMVFDDLPGSYVVQRENTEGWWSKQEDTVMSILGSARLAEGIIRQSRAVEIARQILNPNIDYPVSWGRFDYLAGAWKVDFYLDKEASQLGRSVTVDYAGEVGDDWGVTLSASGVTTKGMTLTVTQQGAIDVMPIGTGVPGSMNLMTGKAYWLEKWNSSGWESVPTLKDAIFTTEGLGIPFGDSVSWKVNWQWLYGELSSGTYRMGKHISLLSPVGDDEDRTYYVTFEVSNPEKDRISEQIEDALRILSEAGTGWESLPEYEMLVSDETRTLWYCFTAFRNGGSSERLEQVMTELCTTIMERRNEEYQSLDGGVYGQSWYRTLRMEAFDLWSDLSDEELERLYPSAWLVLASTYCDSADEGELPVFSCWAINEGNDEMLTDEDAKELYRLVTDGVDWEREVREIGSQQNVTLIFCTAKDPALDGYGSSIDDYGVFWVGDNERAAYTFSLAMSYQESYMTDPMLYDEVMEMLGWTE